MTKNVLARLALAEIPKLLTLLDRNPHSPTHGCFDRNYWHYKIIDFPSGMAQEFVWPLALVHTLDLPDNPYHRSPALRQWVEAGLRFGARSSHADGSCDDYFPYERATGAAAFSLLAGIESYRLLDLDDDPLLRFFERRASWLADHRESGQLSNHEALVVACLVRLSDLLDTRDWDGRINDRLARLLSWQVDEGWFPEYDGCDPGYLTLTISLLAMLDTVRPALGLRAPLERALAFIGEFVHPDGSFGGEYGSRSTYNFFPHGFELAGRWMPEALAINDRVLAGMDGNRAPCYADDHILGHHAVNYLLAWRDFVADRPPPRSRPEGRRYFPAAGLLIERREGTELYMALNKGGVFKLFRDGRFVFSDTQVSLIVRRGRKLHNAVGHLTGDYQTKVTDDEISVSGSLRWATRAQMTVCRLVALRAATFVVGRFFPDLIRRVLQAMLIAANKPAPFEFRRTLIWRNGGWEIEDHIQAQSWANVEQAGIGGCQTSIYAVMSRVFQVDQLQPWQDLTGLVRGLEPQQPLRVVRRF